MFSTITLLNQITSLDNSDLLIPLIIEDYKMKSMNRIFITFHLIMKRKLKEDTI